MIREFSHIVHENFQQLTLKAFLYDMPPWVSHTASTNQTVLFFKVMLCISYSVSKGDIGIAPTRHPVKNASPNYYYAAAGRYFLVSWLKYHTPPQSFHPVIIAPTNCTYASTAGRIQHYFNLLNNMCSWYGWKISNKTVGHIAFSNFYLRIRMRKTALILK